MLWHKHAKGFVILKKPQQCQIIYAINKVKKDMDFVIAIFKQMIFYVLAVKPDFEQNLGTNHFGIKCETISWNIQLVKYNGKRISRSNLH